jgi:tetratricopeptide (TPR) repeat protein
MKLNSTIISFATLAVIISVVMYFYADRVCYAFGDLLLAFNKNGLAFRCFAVTKKSKNLKLRSTALARMADILYFVDKKDDSYVYAHDAIEADKDNPKAYFYAGRALLDKKQYKTQAIALIDKAIELDPNNKKYSAFLAYTYYILEDYDSAQKVYEKIIPLYSGDKKFKLLYMYMNTFNHRKMYKEALKVVDQFGDDSFKGTAYVKHETKGEIYIDLNMPDEALAELILADKADPNLIKTCYYFGVAYRLKGDSDKAASYFKKVISMASVDKTESKKVFYEMAQQQLTFLQDSSTQQQSPL